MNIFENNIEKILQKAYIKHMLAWPNLQNSHLLDIIGLKWEDHREIMEEYRNDDVLNINSIILEERLADCDFAGREKIYLMLLEMTEYGYTINDIALALKADPEKLGILFDEFTSIIAHYTAITNSLKRLNKLSKKEEEKVYGP